MERKECQEEDKVATLIKKILTATEANKGTKVVADGGLLCEIEQN